MDIIIKGEYKVDRKGTTTRNTFKIGNNAICPCQATATGFKEGPLKKYKHCCKGKKLFCKEDLS